MSISDIVSSLSKAQTFDPFSMHAVNDAKLMLVRIHNDNIRLKARTAYLTDELERLRHALDKIANNNIHKLWADELMDIARDALKEGK